MRTTLDIADDVLQAAKELAVKERSTAGEVLSRLARAGLIGSTPSARRTSLKNGVPVFAAGVGPLITLDHVQKMMDEEGI